MNNNIKLYSTESELKAVIIERFNRTLKTNMFKKFTELDDDKNWVSILSLILNQYNNTLHSTIKMTPIEASKKENESILKERFHVKIKKISNKPPKFEVNERIRIVSHKGDFTKGYIKNYSNEIFVIKTVHPTVPYTYSICDENNEVIIGKFYEKEMLSTSFDFGNVLKK